MYILSKFNKYLYSNYIKYRKLNDFVYYFPEYDKTLFIVNAFPKDNTKTEIYVTFKELIDHLSWIKSLIINH